DLLSAAEAGASVVKVPIVLYPLFMKFSAAGQASAIVLDFIFRTLYGRTGTPVLTSAHVTLPSVRSFE
ncbi:MAG: hypothetical protein WA855_15115, partial [Candidatus Acidiferrales bacterium]